MLPSAECILRCLSSEFLCDFLWRNLVFTDFRSGFVDMSLTYYLPQYFQAVLGYGPIGAGIFLIPVLVSQMVLSWISVGS